MNEDYTEQLIESVAEDIFPLEDGYHYFSANGAFSSQSLRVIADHLDDLNWEWEENVQRYFGKDQEEEIHRGT